jgi:hypothetical protein
MKQVKRSHLALVFIVGLTFIFPVFAQAGVGWNVSVGGGYGGGWRPAAYGPGWGPGWRANWAYGGPYYGSYVGYYAPPVVYASPPAVAYMPPPQPMVLAAQPQPAVWYYCQASGKYYPYVQECPSGWQTQSATPPTSSVIPKLPQ